MSTGAVWIKICGVTTVEDAIGVADAGADAIGLNFTAASPRQVALAQARELVRAVGPRVEWVGVFADAEREFVLEAQQTLGLDWLQLHGDETPQELVALGPRAYKALRIKDASDVERASAFAGDRLLVDAKVDGLLGGSGHVFDWALLEPLRGVRRIVLAGGLTPENVASAVASVRPFGIDTASGVESAPGRKDLDKTVRFIRAARSAALSGREG